MCLPGAAPARIEIGSGIGEEMGSGTQQLELCRERVGTLRPYPLNALWVSFDSMVIVSGFERILRLRRANRGPPDRRAVCPPDGSASRQDVASPYNYNLYPGRDDLAGDACGGKYPQAPP